MKHLATTLIGALTLYAVSPAGFAAAPPDDVRRQVVRVADLDLTRPAGVQELYHRIRYAARNVCETFDRLGRDRDCIEQAIARAVDDVGAPLLTTRHQTSTQRPPLPPRQARLDE
jgi:UrcA family protein